MWRLLKKDSGTLCIKLPDPICYDNKHVFACGPNKKYRQVTNPDSLLVLSWNEIKKPSKQNSSEMRPFQLAV